jgi:hypothetical protein
VYSCVDGCRGLRYETEQMLYPSLLPSSHHVGHPHFHNPNCPSDTAIQNKVFCITRVRGSEKYPVA